MVATAVAATGQAWIVVLAVVIMSVLASTKHHYSRLVDAGMGGCMAYVAEGVADTFAGGYKGLGESWGLSGPASVGANMVGDTVDIVGMVDRPHDGDGSRHARIRSYEVKRVGEEAWRERSWGS